MTIIYHNNRCTKSREALALLEKKGETPEVIHYLETPPTEKELKVILKKLGMKAEDLVRRKEELFQKKFSKKKYTEAEWIKILHKHPVLIERPIVIKGNKAVVARPTERLDELF